MAGYVQTAIEPDAITEAMNEDGGFALEVWRELANKLSMGLLLDNACDLTAELDPREANFIAEQFDFLARMIRSRHT